MQQALQSYMIHFRQLRFNLRGGFLTRPFLIAMVLGLAGGFFSQWEASFPQFFSWLPVSVFPSYSDPQAAQVLLNTIATSVMTIVSIVFAVLLMTLTLASMQYSPRIIINFTQDKVTQGTLGIFLGTFGYCIAALPAVRNIPHPFSPVFTLLGAMLLAFLCCVGLLFFIHHISEAISVNHIVHRLARETEAMIYGQMPLKRLSGTETPAVTLEPSINESPIIADVSGYIRYIDTNLLLQLATEKKTAVRVLRRVGHYVPAGIPLMMIAGGGSFSPEEKAVFHSAFELGPTRTLEQDVEFGILQIVDIALKAISPAVNDPSTAISCVDQLSAILITFATREPPQGVLADKNGKLRVSIPWLDFERLTDAAFEQIRMYAQSDVPVSLRMLRALFDIANTLPDKHGKEVLLERARRIVAGCARRLEGDEIREMQARLTTFEAFIIKAGQEI